MGVYGMDRVSPPPSSQSVKNVPPFLSPRIPYLQTLYCGHKCGHKTKTMVSVGP